MENVRYNISPCSPSEVEEFIGKIDVKTFAPNGVVRANEKSHYDRYSYLVGENRIAIVYDTGASILSITGRNDFAQSLLDLFAPNGKAVKRSTVPAHGSVPGSAGAGQANGSTRAKLFVSPDSIRRRQQFAPVPTLFVTSKGAEISTDEIYPPQMIKKKPLASEHSEPPFDTDVIYPPQIIKKRTLPSYGETRLSDNARQTPQVPPQPTVFSQPVAKPYAPSPRTESAGTADSARPVGIAISLGRQNTVAPRRAVISFGTDDGGKDSDDVLKITTRPQSQEPVQTAPAPTEKRKRGRPPKNPLAQPIVQPVQSPTEKRKRGRPLKNPKLQNDYTTADVVPVPVPEYKNGYSVKNFPYDALVGALKRLTSYGKTVQSGETEFSGTVQEVKNYIVTDADGQRVLLRYATKRMTLQLQGKRSNLFGEVMSQVSGYSDYSSALENYVEENGGGKKVSDVQNRLKKRLPTAYAYLSEQSRIDFSYGIHDFSQPSLHLSDYSVLLVPADRKSVV